MTLPAELTPAARSDLREIKDWYEAQRLGLGSAFAARAASTIETLGRFPELFAVVFKDVRAA
ncbi:MAG: hypothetical protein ACRC7O_03590 [Fimbriiglobus sp.]